MEQVLTIKPPLEQQEVRALTGQMEESPTSRLPLRNLGQFSGLATRGHFTLVNHHLERSRKDTQKA